MNRFASVCKATEPSGVLARWYADPFDPSRARTRLRRAHAALESRLCAKRSCITCRLELMIARHALSLPIERDSALLQKLTAGSRRGQALAKLIYGQLLMSRKLSGAMEHLAQGFEVGHNLFDPRDLFIVSKRHRLLGRLHLGARPAPPATLRELLTEAAVISRLESSTGQTLRHMRDPRDTLG